MKKWISAFASLVLSAALCTPSFAASTSETLDSLPDSVEVPVVLSAEIGGGYYTGSVEDGSVSVTGPGFKAEADSTPEGAVRLFVVPIDDSDSVEWFDECVGEHWSSTGTIYAIYYEDEDGNRIEAPGVNVTLEIPGGYENLNVFSVGMDGTSAPLDFMASGNFVTFTTNGKLYSGIVHGQGLMDEETVIGPGAPDTTLDMTSEELEDAVFTDEDWEFLEEGIDIHVRLTVDDITDSVSTSDKQAVESVADGYTIGEYIDIELLKQIGDRPWENVHETNKPIRITIAIPEKLLGVEGREFAIACVHNGKGYLLKDLDNDPATITIETSQFSTYAILYRDPGTAKPGNQDSPSPNAPQTGDISRIDLWLSLMNLSLVGIAVVGLSFWKKKRDARTEREDGDTLSER